MLRKRVLVRGNQGNVSPGREEGPADLGSGTGGFSKWNMNCSGMPQAATAWAQVRLGGWPGVCASSDRCGLPWLGTGQTNGAAPLIQKHKDDLVLFGDSAIRLIY